MTPETLAKQVTSIASLPAVLYRLDEAITDPRASFDDVAQIVGEDTGLTARLLKIVNSPFYGFPSSIETVSRALTMVGTKQLRDLAFATTVVKTFDGIESAWLNMRSFWQHSLACGIASKVIATQLRMSSVERFFLMGMLHDIGRLVLFSQIPEKAKACIDFAKEKDTLLTYSERHVLGFDHAQVGQALLAEWKLPLSQQEIVAYHHTPLKAFRYPNETAIVHLADVICNAMQLGSSGEVSVPTLSIRAWELIGMQKDEISIVMRHTEDEYLQLESLFLQA